MAALTVWATLGLASKVCGSVFGLLMIAVTDTYLPPICEITFAYSFSAPTATMRPLPAVALDEPQPATVTASPPMAITATNIGLTEMVLRRTGMVLSRTGMVLRRTGMVLSRTGMVLRRAGFLNRAKSGGMSKTI